MKKQIPHGDDNLVCPLHRASCSDVCHKCPWWQQVRGTNPNTGEEIDRWDCAVALLPLLLIENSMMQRQTGAAVDSFRNEMVKANQVSFAMQIAERQQPQTLITKQQ